MEASIFEAVDPPPSPEISVFPDTIPAYNLRNKKWVDLEVDQFRDVGWNKQSFSHLVIDNESKELVRALVTNQISREQGTDIIESKGNGLIILLHGGPGTGKTFTAESVAELAEKPLFRVTCGDIGTKPEDVEKYLESVLNLSKIWGCVVLLDEAEVFLEKRKITDLERNALVSVFLRVLEYYEGILILTSNRVGTFDEAFKSRIQLSLHYDDLTKGQRQKIWRNFLERLKSMDKLPPAKVTDPSSRTLKDAEPIAIDFDDVECYISELAEHDMNGRQIRNAITTARQLAKFKKEQMNYSHLQHVIAVSSKFDKYLTSVQEGLTDNQIARDEGVR
ncbi:P-loop containing nucleoside triphosphate hydrolase protein [Pyrenochaeta sp. MPI-SDFR-AT-0127]|nr:P-loop containing nucleoside triphosphate hydrolase protein [Pyrenochaeta sp. MPI-SDFR-AT-0127]